MAIEPTMPCIPIAKLAYVPASTLILKALDTPIPWDATPIAKPRCHQAFTFRKFNMYGANTAPSIPVQTAKIAVRVGDVPILSAIPIAIGAVTDLEYRAPIIFLSAPSSVEMPTALKIDTAPPANIATIKGMPLFFKPLMPRYIGIAKETVAEPNKK